LKTNHYTLYGLLGTEKENRPTNTDEIVKRLIQKNILAKSWREPGRHEPLPAAPGAGALCRVFGQLNNKGQDA